VKRFRSFMPTAFRIVRDRAPLAADYFPNIARVDTQLEHGDLFAFDRTDLNLVGIIHAAESALAENEACSRTVLSRGYSPELETTGSLPKIKISRVSHGSDLR
jgi:hypothetical protein